MQLKEFYQQSYGFSGSNDNLHWNWKLNGCNIEMVHASNESKVITLTPFCKPKTL